MLGGNQGIRSASLPVMFIDSLVVQLHLPDALGGGLATGKEAVCQSRIPHEFGAKCLTRNSRHDKRRQAFFPRLPGRVIRNPEGGRIELFFCYASPKIFHKGV